MCEIVFYSLDDTMQSINIKGTARNVDKFPDECPFCHNKITPIHSGVGSEIQGIQGMLLMQCPTNECKQLFIAYYVMNIANSVFYFQKTSYGTPKSKQFHVSINKTSPAFVEIYNQAFIAEQYNLLEICGVGYRKALEFLIKDFAISINDEGKSEAIKIAFVGRVIKDYISDAIGGRLKIVAMKAVWLGNDETHYIKKWEDKDLKDLKNLIDLTLTMIQAESDFKELQDSMPDNT